MRLSQKPNGPITSWIKVLYIDKYVWGQTLMRQSHCYSIESLFAATGT